MIYHRDCVIALQCHSDPEFGSCPQCPYRSDPDCFSNALKDTIKYIDELEERTNRLLFAANDLIKALEEKDEDS